MIEAAPLIGSVRAMAATPAGRAGLEASRNSPQFLNLIRDCARKTPTSEATTDLSHSVRVLGLWRMDNIILVT